MRLRIPSWHDLLSSRRKAIAALGLLAACIASPAVARIEGNISFAPAAVAASDKSRASILVQNSDAIAAGALTFHLDLPSGLTLFGNGSPASSCGGSFSIAPSGDHLVATMVNGSVPAAIGANPGSCSLSFDVTGLKAASFLATIPAGSIAVQVSGNAQVNNSAASASLTVTLAPLGVTVSYATGYAHGGEPVLRTYRITNSNKIAVTGIDFVVDHAPDLVWIAIPGPPIQNTCGGTYSITEGAPKDENFHSSNVVRLSGAGIAANASCTLAFNTTFARKGTAEYGSGAQSLQLPSGHISTDQGASSQASNASRPAARSGVLTEMLVNGASSEALDVNTGTEAEIVLTLNSYIFNGLSGVVLPVRVPAGLTILNMQTDCGTITTASGGANWSFDFAPVPASSTAWTTTDCVARLRIKANTTGTYTVQMPRGTYAGQYFRQGQVSISASSSPIHMSASFDRAEVYSSDSSIMRIRISNQQDPGGALLEDIRLRNNLATTLPGTLVRNDGILENSCGATSQITASGTSLEFSGFSLPPGSSCDIAYRVIFGSDAVRIAGSSGYTIYNQFSANDLTYRIAGGAETGWGKVARVNIAIMNSLTISTSVSPNYAAGGGRSALSITLTRNSRDGNGLTDITYAIDLPDGLSIDAKPEFTSSCGGTLLSAPGEAKLRVSGGTLALEPGAETGECTVRTYLRVPPRPAGQGDWNIEIVVPAKDLTSFSAQDSNIAGSPGVAFSPVRRGTWLYLRNYQLGLGLGFADAAVSGSGSTRLQVTLSNAANTIPLYGLELAVALPPGVHLAAVPDPAYGVVSGAASQCSNAVFSALPGGSGMRISNARIARNAVCQFSFAVSATSGGNHIITIPALSVSTEEGVTNPDAGVSTLTVSSQISASIGFNPNMVTETMNTEFIVEIINTLPDAPANTYHGKPTSLAYPLPAWLVPAGAAITNCMDAIATLSGTTLLLSGGTFPGISSCQVSVPVTVAVSGSYNVTLPAGSVQTTEGFTNPSELKAGLRVLKAPRLTLSAPPAMTGVNRFGSARLKVENPNAASLNPEGLSGLSLEILAPAGMEANAGRSSSSCVGADLSMVSNGLVITDISLSSLESCEVTFSAKALSAGFAQGRAGKFESGVTPFPMPADILLPWQLAADPLATISLPGGQAESDAPFPIVIALDNPNVFPVAMSAFTLPLPAAPGQITVSGPSAMTEGCGAPGLQANSGASQIQVTGASLPAGGECRIIAELLAPKGGSYNLVPAALQLEYGSLTLSPIVIEVLGTPANLIASRDIRVLADKVVDAAACIALESSSSAQNALPGACIEVTITMENPASGIKPARDILAREDIPADLSFVAVDRNGFDAATMVSDVVSATLSMLAPGEAKSFSYRAIVN
ncbi:hypothetical protein ACEUZ9_000848 [Paracoccus litorisediminis]|uniref:DUF7933 domain-containing protein n=1 Tax=Paracoccus litorisediminis TaxID=2006130 RepID=UPI003731782B